MQHQQAWGCVVLACLYLFQPVSARLQQQQQQKQCGLGQKCCLRCPPEINPAGELWWRVISLLGTHTMCLGYHCT